MEGPRPESERLKRDVEGALRRAVDPADVLPMLHRLSRAAVPGSEESLFAHRQLAELLIERHPWRASIHARRVLAVLPGDDRAWAVIGASQAMLGHYRFAVSAYKRALESASDNPSYAHNLGHLLDVALGRPKEAIAWLASAYSANKESADVAASFAHALARAGDVVQAQKVLGGDTRRVGSPEHAALRSWIRKGAPSQCTLPPLRAPRLTGLSEPHGGEAPSARRGWSITVLETALSRGLTRLPLGANQRGRAVTLARDVARCAPAVQDVADLQTLAAAIAYAIVYIDHVPLTQAEVAGCFRVNASLLRARFKDLRLRLDLTPGDARYATVRRS